MTPQQAKKLCPDLVFVTGNNSKYIEACKRLEEICLRFTPDIEIYSIDEVFLDITGSHHLLGGPENLARAIKDTVRNELKISCTVGMGPNVLMAKLASDLAKPDGLRWIDEDAVASALETLPVKKLWGIGPRTEEKLRAMGITTCGALGRASLRVLVKAFGTIGEQLKDMGNGRLDRPIDVVAAEPKSIGHSITLPKDIWQREEITACLLRLSDKVGRRARRHGHQGRRVTLTVRYTDFKTFTEQITLPACTNDTGEIYRSAVAIIDSIRLSKRIRLLGICLSSLETDGGQMLLFQEGSREKRAALAKAVDAVNDKFGEHTITLGSAATGDEGPGVISPAWRPSGVRNSDV